MSSKDKKDQNDISSESKDPKKLSILYKRKGHFDIKRDEILQSFQQSKAHNELLERVNNIVSEIVHKNPELLLKNRGQLAALIEGTLSRTSSNGPPSSSSLLASSIKPNIEIDGSYGNLLDIFEDEVKRSTVGSPELKDSIKEVLQQLDSESR